MKDSEQPDSRGILVWFQFMNACRVLEGDQDRLDRYVRTARTVFATAVATSGTWIVGSVQDILFQGQAYRDSLSEVLVFPCLLFVSFASSKGGKLRAGFVRRRYAWLPVLGFVVLLGEVVTLFGWWNLGPTLGWWRSGLLVVVAATIAMWATERTVLFLRSVSSN